MQLKMKKKNKRRCCLASIFIIVILIIFMIFKAVNPQIVEKEDVLFSYSMQPEANYKVNFITNNYFTEESDAGTQYIHNLVDNIEVEFTPSFTTSVSAETYSDYTITASLEGYQGSGNNSNALWKGEKILVDSSKKETKKDTGAINETVRVELSQYEKRGNAVLKDLGVYMDFYLVIYIKGEMGCIYEGSKYSEEVYSSVTIPLNQSVFTVNVDKGEKKTDSVKKVQKSQVGIDAGQMFASIIAIVLLVAANLYMIMVVKEPSDCEEKKHFLEKVFEANKNRMIELIEKPDVDVKNYFEVASINELLKVSDELQKPIFYIRDKDTIILEETFFLLDEANQFQYRVR